MADWCVYFVLLLICFDACSGENDLSYLLDACLALIQMSFVFAVLARCAGAEEEQLVPSPTCGIFVEDSISPEYTFSSSSQPEGSI